MAHINGGGQRAECRSRNTHSGPRDRRKRGVRDTPNNNRRTKGRDGVTEGRKAHRSIQDPMSVLPVEIRHSAVEREEKRMPRSRPIKMAEGREELGNPKRSNLIKSEDKRVHALTGNSVNGAGAPLRGPEGKPGRQP